MCVNVEPAGRGEVYCLTVPATGCFAIEGGLIVSNCADDIRYACNSRPWAASKPKPRDPKIDTRKPTINEVIAEHDRYIKLTGNRI